MELVLQRVKTTPEYTVSRMYEPLHKAWVYLDVVEPPVAGLARTTLKSFDPGLYKLFLKSDALTCSVVPVFQKVALRPRLMLLPLLVESHLSAIDFVDHDHFRTRMLTGRLQGENLHPDKEAYDRFVMRLCIAKQAKEKIFVLFK